MYRSEGKLVVETSHGIMEETRFKITKLVLMNLFIIGTLNRVMAIFSSEKLDLNSISLYLAWFLWGYFLVDLIKNRSVDKTAFKFNLFLLFHIPLRVLLTGGDQALITFGYVAHTIFVYAINGKKYGLLMLAWMSVSITVLPFFDLQMVVVKKESLLMLAILMFLNCIFPMIFIVQENISFAKKLGEHGKNRAVTDLMGGLIEQIKLNTKNSRNLLAGEDASSYKNIEDVRRRCLEINSLVVQMGNAAEEGIVARKAVSRESLGA